MILAWKSSFCRVCMELGVIHIHSNEWPKPYFGDSSCQSNPAMNRNAWVGTANNDVDLTMQSIW